MVIQLNYQFVFTHTCSYAGVYQCKIFIYNILTNFDFQSTDEHTGMYDAKNDG